MSLAPAPRTVFEAISDLSSYQYENNVLLNQLAEAQSTAITNHGSLLATLIQVQGTLATTMAAVTAVTQQIADAATTWEKTVAGKPVTVKIEGPVHTEVEQVIVLAETRRLFPGPLLALLNLLHRIELRLADIGIAENRPAREKAIVAYTAALHEFDEHVAAHRHLKGLKPQVKGLTVKLPGETKEAIDAEMLEKLSVLHAISASAVALQAAYTPQNG